MQTRAMVAAVALVTCCGDDATQTGDAGAARSAQDAASTRGEPTDVRDLVTAALTELDSVARLKCPCLVQAGGFQSDQECVGKTGYEAGTIACLSDAFADLDADPEQSGDDADATLAALRCQYEQAHETAACLRERGCEPEAIGSCYDEAAQCPTYDPRLLTRVLQACPGAAVLSR